LNAGLECEQIPRIELGAFAIKRTKARGEKVATFDFLGFTHTGVQAVHYAAILASVTTNCGMIALVFVTKLFGKR